MEEEVKKACEYCKEQIPQSKFRLHQIGCLKEQKRKQLEEAQIAEELKKKEEEDFKRMEEERIEQEKLRIEQQKQKEIQQKKDQLEEALRQKKLQEERDLQLKKQKEQQMLDEMNRKKLEQLQNMQKLQQPVIQKSNQSVPQKNIQQQKPIPQQVKQTIQQNKIPQQVNKSSLQQQTQQKKENRQHQYGSSLIEEPVQNKKGMLQDELNQALINQLMEEDENEILAQQLMNEDFGEGNANIGGFQQQQFENPTGVRQADTQQTQQLIGDPEDEMIDPRLMRRAQRARRNTDLQFEEMKNELGNINPRGIQQSNMMSDDAMLGNFLDDDEQLIAQAVEQSLKNTSAQYDEEADFQRILEMSKNLK